MSTRNPMIQFQRTIDIPSLDTSVRVIIPAMVMQIIVNMPALFCGQHLRAVNINNPVFYLFAALQTCHQYATGDFRLSGASQSTKWQGTMWSCFSIFLQTHNYKNRSVIFNFHNDTSLIDNVFDGNCQKYSFSLEKCTNIYPIFFLWGQTNHEDKKLQCKASRVKIF